MSRANPADRAFRLDGKRAVVTGSSSGIGKAIAREFARAGARVLVHGRRSTRLEALARELDAEDAGAVFSRADLATGEGREQLLQDAELRLGPPDIWVNNAGTDILTGEAAEGGFDEKLAQLLRVDVEATIHLSRRVGEAMRAREGGVILNLGWDQADQGMEGESGQLFGATKAAVMAFTRALAVELAPEVRVHCIAPGWIRTAWGEEAPAEWQARVLEETPLGRWGEPQDIAWLARFLASPAASYLTGQTIYANGGALRS